MQLYLPWVLVFLALVPLTAYLMCRRSGRAPLRFSSLRDVGAVHRSWRIRLRILLVVMRMVCIAMLVVALARPRQGSTHHKISTKGVILELVVDRSGSMQNEMEYRDKQLSRLDVVKQVLSDFITGEGELEGRGNDLLGLITFARYADTACPLVHAHDALLGFLNQTRIPQDRNEDGTAIGEAIALAAARLKTAEEEITRRNAILKAASDTQNQQDNKPEFEIQSKAIILLTDGINNAGQRSPMEATSMAKEWGIKIYTIGIGGGQAHTRVQGPFGNFLMPTIGQELDERLLKTIAEQTGGFYGRADDGGTLRELCEKIDKQEKTEIESIEYSRYEERFGPWVLAALAALMLEITMSCTVFRKIP